MTKEEEIDAYEDSNVYLLQEKVQACTCPICKGGKLTVDISMALIQCDACGISFEYRYNKGVIPFSTFIKYLAN